MIRLVRQLLRLFAVVRILLHHRLDLLLPPSIWLWPSKLFPNFSKPRAVRLREAFEALGPIYVKFGQALSTRRDLLPDDVALELAKLQDQVPPFPGEVAREIIERELGKPIEELFAEFDLRPLASASIAQVHAARLKSGEEVVVKVLRPGIEKQIRRDLELLYLLARLASSLIPEARRLRPVELVREFEATILDELDLVHEGANATQLRRNFSHSEMLYVPGVYWDYTRPKVLTLERVYGIPVSDRKAIERAGVNLKKLAERGVEIFFKQVFDHTFFHADMHPGNVLVDPKSEARYIALDFGIVASLSVEDQYYLAANFLAFFNRDYRRVAELHVESGWVPRHVRVEAFEGAIRAVCEPIFAKPFGEISFGYLLLRLFQVARRFEMEVQPQLLLLQKTLLQIEGLGRQLYPQLDLWQTAKPFLERWFRRRTSPLTLYRKTRQELPYWLENLPETPTRLLRGLEQLENHHRLKAREVELLEGLLRQQRRLGQGLLGTLLIMAALLYPSEIPTVLGLLGGGFLLGRGMK